MLRFVKNNSFFSCYHFPEKCLSSFFMRRKTKKNEFIGVKPADAQSRDRSIRSGYGDDLKVRDLFEDFPYQIISGVAYPGSSGIGDQGKVIAVLEHFDDAVQLFKAAVLVVAQQIFLYIISLEQDLGDPGILGQDQIGIS